MDKKIAKTARKKLGEYLKKQREEKGITTKYMKIKYDLRIDQIKSIENGTSNYTMDLFLLYVHAIDCYLFLADRDEKHLDFNDMIRKMDEN